MPRVFHWLFIFKSGTLKNWSEVPSVYDSHVVSWQLTENLQISLSVVSWCWERSSILLPRKSILELDGREEMMILTFQHADLHWSQVFTLALHSVSDPSLFFFFFGLESTPFQVLVIYLFLVFHLLPSVVPNDSFFFSFLAFYFCLQFLNLLRFYKWNQLLLSSLCSHLGLIIFCSLSHVPLLYPTLFSLPFWGVELDAFPSFIENGLCVSGFLVFLFGIDLWKGHTVLKQVLVENYIKRQSKWLLTKIAGFIILWSLSSWFLLKQYTWLISLKVEEQIWPQLYWWLSFFFF